MSQPIISSLSALVLVVLAAAADVSAQAVEGPPATPAARETWYLMLLDDLPVGHLCQRVEPVAGSTDEIWTQRLWMRTNRFGQTTTQDISWTCRQDRAGHPLRVGWSIDGGDHRIAAEGAVRNHGLQVTLSSGGSQSSYFVELPPKCRGFAAVEQSLSETPMQPGEVRSFPTLTPLKRTPADIRLQAFVYEDVPIDGEQLRLLRVEQQTDFGRSGQLRAQLWFDSAGQLVQARLSDPGQRIIRASRTAALAVASSEPPEIGWSSLMRIAHTPSAPDQRPHLTYRVVTNLPAPFASTDSQTVRTTDDGFEVKVQALQPRTTRSSAVDPQHGQRAAGVFVQTQQAAIQQASQQVAVSATDPWVIGTALEHHVFQLIKQKDSAWGFASAADTLSTRRGDCTEHAVLLAALCRARQIPARIVIGLQHVVDDRFGYHMWNEVRVDGQWIGLDATAGRGGVGPARLTILTTELADDALVECFTLATQRLPPAIQIEILP